MTKYEETIRKSIELLNLIIDTTAAAISPDQREKAVELLSEYKIMLSDVRRKEQCEEDTSQEKWKDDQRKKAVALLCEEIMRQRVRKRDKMAGRLLRWSSEGFETFKRRSLETASVALKLKIYC